MEDLAKLLIGFDAGDITPQSLIDWAIGQLQEGKDSASLNELAWLYGPGRHEARELFLKAIEELSYNIPPYPERQVLLAKEIAKKIISGEKDINQGCGEIADISRELDSPDSLSVFELLAHEQHDHENIGITAENIKPSIIDSARGFLANET